MLLSAINLAYYQQLTAGMRAAIRAGGFAEFRAATREMWDRGDIPAGLERPQALDAAPTQARMPPNNGDMRRR